jgi:hypothetical protein
MPDQDDDDDKEGQFRGSLPQHSWSQVKTAFGEGGTHNRHRALKGTAKGLSLTARGGLTAAGFATQNSTLAVAGAIAAGAAVSATGIGLVAAGGALMIGTAILDINAVASTIAHLEGLEALQRNVGNFANCKPTPSAKDAGVYHAFIADKVLGYIISQKKEKVGRKGVGIVPGGSILTGAYTLGRMLFKKNKGVKRNFYANALGEHLITCSCPLAKQIVTNLLGSAADMQQLMHMNLDQVGPIIANKMKSF